MVVTTNVTPRQFVLAVGATSVEVSPEPGNRKRLVVSIKNTSTAGQVVTLGFGQDAVANIGLVLNPADYITDSTSEGYDASNLRITAIASAAGGQISVFERYEE